MEQLARDLPVQAADAVGALGQAQAHHGHVEHRAVAVRLGAEVHDPVDVQPRLDPAGAEVALDEGAREPVDARLDRGVGGEDRAGAGRLDGAGRVQALVLDQAADPLEPEVAGVALVGVEDLGPEAERVQRPHPADAEEDLLPEAVLAAAAVEAVGDRALHRGVAVHVRVEQEQRHAAHVRPPELREQRSAVGQPHVDAQRQALAVGDQLQRQLLRVEGGVRLDLPAVGGQGLPEVPRPVEQPHADQRHAEVTGRLEVVAGQHAEPAGVLRQDLADAELGREVGDPAGRAAQRLVPARLAQVPGEVVGGGRLGRQEGRVGRGALQHGGVRLVQHPQRVVARGLPAGRVHRGEQLLHRRVPGPAQVASQDGQGLQWLRHGGQHREAL